MDHIQISQSILQSFHLSKGTLPGMENPFIWGQWPAAIGTSWTNNQESEHASGKDIPHFTFIQFHPNNKYKIKITEDGARTDEEKIVTFPIDWRDYLTHVFVFFKAEFGNNVSKSQYLGSVIMEEE